MSDDRIRTMLKAAAAEVGYHEGHSGGHWNNQQKYSGQVPGLEWSDGDPWCAVFVYWCFIKAGIVDLLPKPRTAWVPDFITWAKQHSQWSEYPAVGAPVIFGGGRHIGIVESYTADTVTTIEGNTNSSGSPEGDGVYRKVHRRRDPWVTGYLYPAVPLVSADPAYNAAHPQEAAVSQVPADVIDLRNSKLTRNDASEVKQPALATYADAYFKVTPSGDGVAFRAKVHDGTTPTSTHTRCEEREMINNGLNLAAWDNHHGTHERVAAYRVTHLPKNKPEAVVMQIHDPKDDVVMVRVVGAANPLAPIKIYAEWSKGKGLGSVKELLGSVHLGQKFYVRIVADPSGIRVRLQVSGSTTVTERKRSTVRGGLFFKAGCYNQSDTDHDAASDYAEIVIYKDSLRTRHVA